jgi:prepilin-type N-terminal cleavage/methylation domain-containing protein
MKIKVHGFTLNEMVIVMIISTIVIGMAFSVLSMVQRHMWSIQNNFSLNTELNRLEQALWIDINRYNAIRYNGIENELQFKSAIDSTVYQFKSDYVLKDRDTFHITIEEKIFYFNGTVTNSEKVDAFRLELPKQQQDKSLFIFKRNDATQFID